MPSERLSPSRYPLAMPKRSRKTPRDTNQLAAFILKQVTEPEPEPAPETEEEREARERSEIARKLGRAGGLKGGKARAAKLTKKQRSESAKKAARARWRAAKTAGKQK